MAEHILISLESRFAERIFDGTKRVELRRRRMNVAPGTTAWIYVKVPVGCVVGTATITRVESHSPATIWRRYGAVAGIAREEFFAYFDGVTTGSALVIGETTKFERKVSLDALRSAVSTFRPPQFFARLPATHPLRDVDFA